MEFVIMSIIGIIVLILVVSAIGRSFSIMVKDFKSKEYFNGIVQCFVWLLLLYMVAYSIKSIIVILWLS